MHGTRITLANGHSEPMSLSSEATKWSEKPDALDATAFLFSFQHHTATLHHFILIQL